MKCHLWKMERNQLFYLLLVTINSYCKGAEFDYDVDDENIEHPRELRKEKVANSVGTNLLTDRGFKKCFSSEDVTFLAARYKFEHLKPVKEDECALTDKAVTVHMKYFCAANRIILKTTYGGMQTSLQKAFYDLLGGHLNHYLVPVTKISFYSGTITLKTTLNVYSLYQESKGFLNTHGNAWKPAIADFSDFNLNTEPLKIFFNEKFKAAKDNKQGNCVNLNLSDDEDMIVSLPKLRPNISGFLTNIWLPFRRTNNFDLRSYQSAYILIRYYVSVSKCYHFQGVSQFVFNKRLIYWLETNVENHLNDEILYPGLGAVLRIFETLKLQKQYIFSTNKKKEAKHEDNVLSEVSKSTDDVLGFFEKIFGRSKNFRHGNGKSYPHSIDYNSLNYISVEQNRKRHIVTPIVVAVSIFLFVLSVAVLSKYMSLTCKKTKKRLRENKNDKYGTFCHKLSSCCIRKRYNNPQTDEDKQRQNGPAIKLENKKLERNLSQKLSRREVPGTTSKGTLPAHKEQNKCMLTFFHSRGQSNDTVNESTKKPVVSTDILQNDVSFSRNSPKQNEMAIAVTSREPIKTSVAKNSNTNSLRKSVYGTKRKFTISKKWTPPLKFARKVQSTTESDLQKKFPGRGSQQEQQNNMIGFGCSDVDHLVAHEQQIFRKNFTSSWETLDSRKE